MLLSDLVGMLILAFFSLGAGLLVNQFRENPLPLVYSSKVERLQNSVQRIAEGRSVTSGMNSKGNLPAKMTLESFSHYVETKQGLILDARPTLFYRVGHVPGALSLPREDFEEGYTALQEKLEQNYNQLIAIYCSDAECEDSKLVRNSLLSLGYKNLSVFEPGWSAWSEAKKPVEKAR